MNPAVVDNYSRVKASDLFLPLLVLLLLAIGLYSQNALNTNAYINIQKDSFYYLNSQLGQYPRFIYNLTHLGDTLVLLGLLSVFLINTPAVWEALISVSIISSLVSVLLKNLFSVPRPAAFLDSNTFIIIGDKLAGHSSLPSGHSITVFTSLTVLLFAFMPQKKQKRAYWTFFILSAGLLLALTRVGVGAHYPLDVLTGSTVGYLTGVAGIMLSRKYRIWFWVGEKRYYPVFMVLLLACIIVMLAKIKDEVLPVYCLSLAALIFSFYKITDAYFKK